MNGARLRCLLLMTLAACATPAPPAGTPAAQATAPGALAPPTGFHGVVVWFEPRADTMHVDFEARWQLVVSGRDSVWMFPAADAGEGRTAYGHLRVDTLVWELAWMSGDLQIAAGFAGSLAPDGSVRGCGQLRRRPARAAAASAPPRAAFALGPRSAPRAAAHEAPAARCGP